MNFCVAILILKKEENTHFWRSVLYYFKIGKNTTEIQKKIRAVYGEGAKVLSGRPVEVDSDQIKTLIDNHQCYNTWEIADILNISKSIKLSVKIKNVSFILQKKLNGLLANPIEKKSYRDEKRMEGARPEHGEPW